MIVSSDCRTKTAVSGRSTVSNSGRMFLKSINQWMNNLQVTECLLEYIKYIIKKLYRFMCKSASSRSSKKTEYKKETSERGHQDTYDFSEGVSSYSG